jgi:N-acetylglucosamine-6-phosphate deacetylase
VNTILVQNGDVLHAGRIEMSSRVMIQDRSISLIGRDVQVVDGAEILDASGCYVLPGLIDIHTHGLFNVMVDKDSIHEYARFQAENGVTSCLPTLAGSPEANIRRMRHILDETQNFKLTPNLVGFRPEIMYLVDASAGPSTSLARPEPGITQAVWEASQGLIKVWDISPEIEGALPFIAWCAEHGIVTSMAHSCATIDQLRAAIEAGLSHVTHFYDLFVIPKEVDEGVYPAGITDYINIEDRLTVEIIPDGVHAHPLLVEKTLRCKGIDRVLFITDSLKGSGMPPGTYEGLIPGEPVEVTEGRGIRRKSDDILSGSAITHLTAFRNAVMKFGRSIPEASGLCSANPARLLGLRHKGHLAAGMDADLIILDRDLRLQATILQGHIVYRK